MNMEDYFDMLQKMADPKAEDEDASGTGGKSDSTQGNEDWPGASAEENFRNGYRRSRR